MVPIFRTLLLTSVTLFVTSCASGGAGGAIPSPQQPGSVVSQAGAVASLAREGRHYVAQALPANFVPSAIMPSGAIPGSLGRDAAVFHDGRIDNLGTFDAEYAVAFSVNRRGEAVGASTRGQGFDGVDVPGRALLFTSGKVQELHGLPGTDFNDARAIDNAGNIYGGSGSRLNDSGPRTIQLVRFTPGENAQPVTPVLFFNDENADSHMTINDRGIFTVTRAGDGTATFPNRAFVGHGLTIAPVIGTEETEAAGINDRDQVAGSLDTVGTQPLQTFGFLHDARGTRRLSLFPTGINNRGAIVGTDSSGAVLIERRGTTYRLNSLLESPLHVSFVVRGLSERGEFVVFAGQTYYLVKPDRDPS